MTRRAAIRLLFWFHDREGWNNFHLRCGYYVWPPFPREDEFLGQRIKLYNAAPLAISERRQNIPFNGRVKTAVFCRKPARFSR